jgi:hypothetical protein
MNGLKTHFTHHRNHMLGCGLAGLGVVTGIVFEMPVLAISAAIVCGALCISMIRMLFAMGPKAHHQ